MLATTVGLATRTDDHAPVDDAAALGAFQFHKSKLTEWIGNASVATVATRESTYATTRVLAVVRSDAASCATDRHTGSRGSRLRSPARSSRHRCGRNTNNRRVPD